MQKQVIRICANAWAAFLDFAAGVGIVAIISMFEATLLQLLIGGMLALLPDYINIPWIYKILTGQKIPYDHHANWSHRPVLMIPAVALICGLLGGERWTLIGLVCLLWHFLHDYPFGDGYLNWGWLPFGWGTPDRTVLIDHDYWLDKNWLRHSWKFQTEVGSGIAIFVVALMETEHQLLSVLALVVLMLLFFSWHLVTRQYEPLPDHSLEV